MPSVWEGDREFKGIRESAPLLEENVICSYSSTKSCLQPGSDTQCNFLFTPYLLSRNSLYSFSSDLALFQILLF